MFFYVIGKVVKNIKCVKEGKMNLTELGKSLNETQCGYIKALKYAPKQYEEELGKIILITLLPGLRLEPIPVI